MSAKLAPQFFAAMSVCIGALALGTVIAWTANISDDLKSGKLNNMEIKSLNWIGSLMPLGAVFACFPIGFLMDIIGKKLTALLTIIPFTVGWCCITFVPNLMAVYAGRFLCGFAGASFCVVAPSYNSEVAEVRIRGMIGTFFQLFITFGILYAQVLAYLLPMMVYNIACLIIPLLFGVFFVFQPESPVSDLIKGREDHAVKSFKRLRGDTYDFSGELNQLKKDIEEQKSRANFWQAMKSKSSIKATTICFMLMFYQQLSGINAVMFYANSIFIDAGSALHDKLCTISIGVIQVISTVVAAAVIDKFGRKILLLISCFFMAIGTFFLGLYFSLKTRGAVVIDGEEGPTTAPPDYIESLGWLPVTALNLFIIAFSLGLGPIPWLASGEMFSNEIKSKCSAAAATFNWFLAFIVTMYYGPCSETIGTDITFYFFTVVLITGFFFTVLCIPETKGKTEAEIKEMLGG